jgi:hypothetical protein
MGQPRVTSEKLIVNASYVATTFRFLQETAPPRPAK